MWPVCWRKQLMCCCGHCLQANGLGFNSIYMQMIHTLIVLYVNYWSQTNEVTYNNWTELEGKFTFPSFYSSLFPSVFCECSELQHSLLPGICQNGLYCWPGLCFTADYKSRESSLFSLFLWQILHFFQHIINLNCWSPLVQDSVQFSFASK